MSTLFLSAPTHLPAMSLWLLILGALLVVYLFHHFHWKRRSLPPGPTPWPLLGNIVPIMRAERAEDVLAEWHRQYGPIITIWLMHLPQVSVTGDCVEQLDEFPGLCGLLIDNLLLTIFDFQTHA